MKAKWRESTLGQVCQFENGDRGKNYPGRKAFVPEGVPFINAGHLDDGRVAWDKMNFISEARFKLLGSGKVRKGDVLYCLRGSLGKFGVVDRDGNGAIASSLVIVRPKEFIDPGYLAMYLRSPLADDMVAKHAGGAAQPNLSAKNLAEYQLPLPPLDEQKRIVAVLDEAFEGLARARENAEANLHDARELFRRELDEVFNQISVSGRRSTIADIAKIRGGKRLPKGALLLSDKTPFPYISVKDFNDEGSVDAEGVRYLDAETHGQIRNYIVRHEDMYISIAGTIGKTGIVPPELSGANLTENAARLVFRDDVSNEYVYFFSLTRDFQEQAGLNTRTAAQPKLALARLGTISVPMTPRYEQDRVVLRSKALRERIMQLRNTYSQKIAQLSDLRQSLLHEAFAGGLT